VPGDVVLITKIDWVVPCDMIILNGSCIVNESGLTGESMPVQKKACKNDSAVIFDPKNHHIASHILFAGTTLLQLSDDDSVGTPKPLASMKMHKQKPDNCDLLSEKDFEIVEACVTATASSTNKGQIVSAILFPEKLRFRYEEELEVVIVLLLMFSVVAFVLVIYLITLNGSKASWITKWAYGIFTASQIFSPLLPVALKIGQIRSSQRLSQKGVFCISPRHIAICGKIDLLCFDKTGTLTAEGMSFSGCIPVVKDVFAKPCMSSLKSKFKHSTSVSSPAESSSYFGQHNVENPLNFRQHYDDCIPESVEECMAVCHNVASYGESKLVGNEVEVRMFAATRWSLGKYSMITDGVDKFSGTLVISPKKDISYRILKRFEFDHERQCMSVIAENEQTRIRYIVTKGSFEKLALLCDENTIPSNFVEKGRENAMQGGYVLGIARKELSSDNSEQALERISRDEVEKIGSLELLSLLIFRNEPKSESETTIRSLRSGSVRSVMITGDNAECAQYISRICSLVPLESHILIGEYVKEQNKICWRFMGGENALKSNLFETSIKLQHDTCHLEKVLTTEEVVNYMMNNSEIELALTGNETLHALDSASQLMQLLKKIKIFARMSPENKSFLVRKFREAGHIVGMCGDGGNDCGALRAAHAGMVKLALIH
jgi:predicted P-type ATPase